MSALRVLAAALALSALAVAPAHALKPAAGCSLYASPRGDDAGSGRAAKPFETAQRLAGALRPGQTGCLVRGTYAGGMTFRAGDVTVRPYSRGRAVVVGQVWVADGADRVTVRDLRLDGTNADGKPSPMVNGDDAVFTGNDVSSGADSCFVLGDPVWGVAERTRIEGNDIHDCGVHGTNMDHGIYVRHAIGTQVLRNVIRDNPDRGVQFFPNGDRSVVRGNLIDGNGQGVTFSGDGRHASDGNLVEGNLITDSRLRTDVEYWWTGPIGTGNVLRGNCIHGGVRGAIKLPALGFAVGANRYSPTGCSVSPPRLGIQLGR